MGKTKVICICIDGGEKKILDAMIARGCMPAMARILENHPLCPLDGYINGPGQGWASFITGKNPEKHGIYFWKVAQGVNASTIGGERIWEVIGRKGLTSGVINMSYTYPPRPMEGFTVAGLGGGLVPDKHTNYFFPPELKEEVDAEVGGYVAGIRRTIGSLNVQEKYLQACVDMEKKRIRTGLYLMSKFDPDCLIYTIKTTDQIQHSFWRLLDPDCRVTPETSGKIDPLLDAYFKTVDEMVEKLWFGNPDANRFIISDHGFGPTKQIFYLNEWLASEGFLQKKTDAKAKYGTFYYHKLRKLVEPVYYKYLVHFKSVRNINKARKKRLPAITSAIDWDTTQLYSKREQGIYFNRQVVDTPEKEAQITEEINGRLLALTCPETGQPIVNAVYSKSQLSEFAQKENAPDLFFDFSDEGFIALHNIFEPEDAKMFQPLENVDIGYHNGSHRRYGICVSSHQMGDRDRELRITDVSATILDLFGIDVPGEMDGTPIKLGSQAVEAD